MYNNIYESKKFKTTYNLERMKYKLALLQQEVSDKNIKSSRQDKKNTSQNAHEFNYKIL
jgi:hypothetical protein